jgi:hypothetical protein
MGLWLAWQGTSCTDWDGGRITKLPGVQNRLWLVPGVRHGNVDGLERYRVYRMGMWMVWKGTQSTVWDVVGTQREEWDCGWLGKVAHVRNEIVYGLERCPEYGMVDDCWRHGV